TVTSTRIFRTRTCTACNTSTMISAEPTRRDRSSEDRRQEARGSVGASRAQAVLAFHQGGSGPTPSLGALLGWVGHGWYRRRPACLSSLAGSRVRALERVGGVGRLRAERDRPEHPLRGV